MKSFVSSSTPSRALERKTRFHPRLFIWRDKEIDAPFGVVLKSSNMKVKNRSKRTTKTSKKERNSNVVNDMPNYHRLLKTYVEECSFISSWQKTSNPTCNSVHESTLIQDYRIIDDGGTRMVWRTFNDNSSENTYLGGNDDDVIFKTWHLGLDKGMGFGNQDTLFWDMPSGLWMNKAETQALDALTASPHILNVYSYCGQSQISELASGFLEDKVKAILKSSSSDNEEDNNNSNSNDDDDDDNNNNNNYYYYYNNNPSLKLQKKNLERMRLAIDTAWAINDIHSIDYPNSTNSSLAHVDLHLDNVVLNSNDRVQILDFNRAIPIKWHTSQPCGLTNPGGDYRWRAPETYHFTKRLDKADIFSLGGLLYFILTGIEPWRREKIARKELTRKKKNKILVVPPFPRSYDDDEVELALYLACIWCLQVEPMDRPTAHQVATKLEQSLEWILNKNKEEVLADKKKRIRQLFPSLKNQSIPTTTS